MIRTLVPAPTRFRRLPAQKIALPSGAIKTPDLPDAKERFDLCVEEERRGTDP